MPIITNQDIIDELNYLISLNNNLKSLENIKLNQIAIRSIIKEKIKYLELKKYFKIDESTKEVDDIVAVRKPATVPVHPTGQYRNNSVVEILRHRQRLPANTPPLLPLHRLDRNVSGLLLMAKTSEAAKIATDLIVSNKVRKEYVARVKGLFRKEAMSCEVPLGFCGKTHVATWPSSSIPFSSLYKSAKTSFTLIKHFSESNESLVRCVPETGRTHQIRVHLTSIGHPLIGDKQYGKSPLRRTDREMIAVVVSTINQCHY